MKFEWTHTIRQHMLAFTDGFGKLLVDGFHYLALFAIGGAIAWSALHTFLAMGTKGHAGIDDILLLFIYLELGAMVGIYFKTNHMPIRFLLYVAMTALTHQMISVTKAHNNISMDVLLLSGAMLILALAILVIRYGSAKYPVLRGSTEAL